MNKHGLKISKLPKMNRSKIKKGLIGLLGIIALEMNVLGNDKFMKGILFPSTKFEKNVDLSLFPTIYKPLIEKKYNEELYNKKDQRNEAIIYNSLNYSKSFLNGIPSSVQYNDLELRVLSNGDENLLFEALKLTFDVYVVEKEYVKYNTLNNFQKEKKIYYDEYDFLPSTTHIVGLKNGKVVSRARLIDGKTPMTKYFSNLNKKYKTPVRELSKLITAPKERKALNILINMCNYIYNISKEIGEFYCTSFPDGAKMYKGMGAEEIGTYYNPEYPHDPESHVFRWDAEDLKTAYLQNMDIKKRFIEQIVKPLS